MGSSPSRAVGAAPSVHGPPSPLPQNPSASIHARVRKEKPSYICAVSTSLGLRSVRDHICAAASRQENGGMSSHWSHDGRPCSADPTALTLTAPLGASPAVSTADT